MIWKKYHYIHIYIYLATWIDDQYKPSSNHPLAVLHGSTFFRTPRCPCFHHDQVSRFDGHTCITPSTQTWGLRVLHCHLTWSFQTFSARATNLNFQTFYPLNSSSQKTLKNLPGLPCLAKWATSTSFKESLPVGFWLVLGKGMDLHLFQAQMVHSKGTSQGPSEIQLELACSLASWTPLSCAICSWSFTPSGVVRRWPGTGSWDMLSAICMAAVLTSSWCRDWQTTEGCFSSHRHFMYFCRPLRFTIQCSGSRTLASIHFWQDMDFELPCSASKWRSSILCSLTTWGHSRPFWLV